MPNTEETKTPVSAGGGYTQITAECTEEDFLSGRIGYAMGFNNPNQIMVDLWGEGFEITEPLTSPDEVGRYCQAREQLAAYMRKRILEEYVRFGCAPEACGWYDRTAEARRALLIDLGARAVAVRRGAAEKPGTGYVAMDKFLMDGYRTVVGETYKVRDPESAAKAPLTFGSLHVEPTTSDYICAITGDASTVSVKFVLNTWEDMELVLGEELPKVLKGWQRFRVPVKHRSRPRYDPVGMVGAPVEHCMLAYYQTHRDKYEAAGLNPAQEEQYLSGFDPSITIGFSDKGLQKAWKKLGI